MDPKISLEELSKTSFIKCDYIDDRLIPLQSCFNDDHEWETWFPGPNGLMRIKGSMVEGSYFAKDIAEKGDGFIAFNNFMMKRAYFNNVVGFVHGIMEDIHNLGASIGKINLLHEVWRDDHSRVSRRYVASEVEYIFSTCRSVFDLLQEVIYRLWRRFRYLDKNKKTKSLKRSFPKMVLRGDRILSVEEIEKKYLIPEELARFYYKQAGFFLWLRDYRDRIAHGGKGFKHVLILEKGFAVPIDEEPFDSLCIWNEANTSSDNRRLGSLRSVVAHVCLNTIKAMEEYTHVISSIMEMPYDIAPDYLVFERGGHISDLIEAKKYISDEPWVSELST